MCNSREEEWCLWKALRAVVVLFRKLTRSKTSESLILIQQGVLHLKREMYRTFWSVGLPYFLILHPIQNDFCLLKKPNFLALLCYAVELCWMWSEYLGTSTLSSSMGENSCSSVETRDTSINPYFLFFEWIRVENLAMLNAKGRRSTCPTFQN